MKKTRGETGAAETQGTISSEGAPPASTPGAGTSDSQADATPPTTPAPPPAPAAPAEPITRPNGGGRFVRDRATGHLTKQEA